jgi:hypothetical protein
LPPRAPGFSFKDDNATKPIGLSPPDNGTAIRVVEFPPLAASRSTPADPATQRRTCGSRIPRRLLLASSPVTTRRTSAAVALEHANRTAKIDQNVLCIIASSLVLPERRRRWAAHGGLPLALANADRDRHACSSMRSCLPK